MKAFRTILILVLILALLGAGFWYFFIYQSGLPAHLYASYAAFAEESGSYESAAQFYAKAMELEPGSSEYALNATNAYRKAGNYTKAEYTLTRAISNSPESSDLYVARTFPHTC